MTGRTPPAAVRHCCDLPVVSHHFHARACACHMLGSESPVPIVSDGSDEEEEEESDEEVEGFSHFELNMKLDKEKEEVCRLCLCVCLRADMYVCIYASVTVCAAARGFPGPPAEQVLTHTVRQALLTIRPSRRPLPPPRRALRRQTPHSGSVSAASQIPPLLPGACMC